ncbi:uncharacterized protein RJT20DRAFT_33657 [Scheffersomyces xylosifermentans]|uniref:uncharacterized protein n=1 Tax=Scheffersomyces xylosifermentans TaxID=1304137 RepID=UPI00315CC877
MFSSPDKCSRKRRVDDVHNDDDSEFGNGWSSQSSEWSQSPSNESKRLQQHRIHSEIHTHTIQVMMNAQLELQRREREHRHEDGEQAVEEQSHSPEASEASGTFRQKPFWPSFKTSS